MQDSVVRTAVRAGAGSPFALHAPVALTMFPRRFRNEFEMNVRGTNVENRTHACLRHVPAVALFALLCLAAAPRLDAQAFGKNKVQYDTFTWYYLQSEHFDVYFTDGGEALASYTAMAAEKALVSIQRDFRYQVTNRIPVVVYNSHNDFQQTNVIDMYMEEGIGGVTELFKNRVVIPFEGSYSMFRHVIHHELVHAVLNDMFYGGSIQSIITNGIRLELPLWFNEGIAEFEAQGGWDPNSDMFLRDASTSNYLPPIPYLHGYFAYRGGQSVWWYIAEKYGRQKIGEILNRVRGSRNIDAGFKASIGLTVEELSERWMKEQKVLYYPDVAKRTSPEDYAKRLTNHTKLENFYNTSPAVSPGGDKVAFISDRDDYFSVYVMSTSDDKSTASRLIEGQTTNDFEELHLLTPGITWSPDGASIALSSKAGASDAIFLVDVESGRRTRLPVELDGIFSVAWSPDGARLAFVGNTEKQSDIWVYDFDTKTARNLTDDIFSDAQPSWTPDGTALYFVSDRGDYLSNDLLPASFRMIEHDVSQADVYRIDLRGGTMRRITTTPDAAESYPVMGPDSGRMLYISDKNGINNIYLRNLEDGSEHPLTNSLSGVYQLSLSRDGNKLLFASMYEAGFDLFLLKSPFSMAALPALEPTEHILRLQRESEVARRHAQAGDSAVADLPQSESRQYGDSLSVRLGLQEAAVDTTTGAWSRQRILFTPGGESQSEASSRPILAVKNNVNDKGEFIVNRYKISFTPDLVYGNAGYSTFYGVMGSTQVMFSDMLGNHQIYLLTNLIGDLKNSDFAGAYYNLPGRIDWGIQGFHTARFIYGAGAGFYNLYLYRQYGGGLIARYPLDKFNRFDGALTLMNISQENQEDPDFPATNRLLLLPELSYVHDNSLWGTWSPVKGSRYELRAFGSPGINGSSQFLSLTGDYRKYYKFWDDFSVVVRGAAGASVGRNPQRFFIGGTENWINRTFENGYIPIESAEDFAFLTAVLPLRGFNYNARIGTKYVVGNAELRFPLVRYFMGGVLPYILQSVNAAMFVDVGSAVDDIDTYKAFRRDAEGHLFNGDLLAGTGVGMRMWFLGFPLRFDVAWAYLGSGFSTPRYYFSLGADF